VVEKSTQADGRKVTLRYSYEYERCDHKPRERGWAVVKLL
jgi:hypothetical protein